MKPQPRYYYAGTSHDVETYTPPPHTWKDKIGMVIVGFAGAGILFEIVAIGYVLVATW